MDFLWIIAAGLCLVGIGAAVTYTIAFAVPLHVFVTAQEHGRFADLVPTNRNGRHTGLATPCRPLRGATVLVAVRDRTTST